MDTRLEAWKKAKKTREDAEEWQELPNGRKYDNDRFNVSAAHCKPPILCRAGQQTHSGQNYWETEVGFNDAMLRYLVADWDSIYPKVLKILKETEAKKLRECQSFIDDLQRQISEAQNA
jgi:hypothetical protein